MGDAGSFRVTHNIPGRISKVELWEGERDFGSSTLGQSRATYWGVHNIDLDPPTLHEICNEICSEISDAREDPMNRSVWLIGDFNIHPLDEPRHLYKEPSRPNADDADAYSRAGQREFSRVFELLRELKQPGPTHYSARFDSGLRIDRIFTSLEPWILTSLQSEAFTLEDPKALHLKGISDHSPSVARLKACKPVPSDRQPIPPEITKHPNFPLTSNAT